tara:strand:- start:7128 stop:7784 length:657 start_codon:yes stop_codon:yes gene_type:complete
MKKNILFLFLSLLSINLTAQVFTFISQDNNKFIKHKILKDSNYLIETQYTSNSNEFVSTRGGFYELTDNSYKVNFEFNSNYINDSLKTKTFESSKWEKEIISKQDHSGKWLMAGRVREGIEKRRKISGPRKTLKFLIDGHFQWTAFNTESFIFFGSGGGTYTAELGNYVENITYFSRDNSRVGAILPFRYDIRGSDWHHKGFNSKGQPMYEIWTARGN